MIPSCIVVDIVGPAAAVEQEQKIVWRRAGRSWQEEDDGMNVVESTEMAVVVVVVVVADAFAESAIGLRD